MKELSYGLKLWSINKDLIDQAKKLIEKKYFNYIELTYVPETDIKPFLDDDIDYMIHLPTNRHGVNIGDLNKKEENLELIRKGLEWADRLSAKYAILHPGYGSFENVKIFLSELEDERILIENMPRYGLNNEDMVGYSKEEILELKNDRFGFCFDLNHAIKAAITLNEDYKEYIKELLRLNSQMFHVADGRLDFEKDEHLDMGEGEYDWKFLINVIKESDCDYVTLETPRETLKDDLKNLRSLKVLIWI